MLEIQVRADIREGKTTELMQIACGRADMGRNVLIVLPTDQMARQIWHSDCSIREASNIEITGAGSFMRVVTSKPYATIVFDNLEMFPKSREGDWLSVARARLATQRYPALVYSRPPRNAEAIWIPEAVWYKPWTWGKGRWELA